MSTLKEMTDEQLALLYADGNNKAFDILLSRVQNKLFSYIFCMVKNEAQPLPMGGEKQE